MSFYFVLSYLILSYLILFYFTLFYFISFHFILFCFVLFCFVFKLLVRSRIIINLRNIGQVLKYTFCPDICQLTKFKIKWPQSVSLICFVKARLHLRFCAMWLTSWSMLPKERFLLKCRDQFLLEIIIP